MDLAYVNGKISRIKEAAVPVEDRGYQFGDGVYEMVNAYSGTYFALPEHLDRLQQSARGIDLQLPLSLDELSALAWQLLRQSGLKDAQLYIQVTRGQAPRNHPFPESTRPSLVITLRESQPLPDHLAERGVSVLSLPDIRWKLCHIKSTNLLPNVLAKEKARAAGHFEAIFVQENGLVSEGASSNVFVVHDRLVITPPANERILNGITRQFVLKLAREEGIPIEEAPVSYQELLRSTEVFLTGTSIQVLPVVTVDGHQVGNGRPGPVTSALAQAYQRLLQDHTTKRHS